MTSSRARRNPSQLFWYSFASDFDCPAISRLTQPWPTRRAPRPKSRFLSSTLMCSVLQRRRSRRFYWSNKRKDTVVVVVASAAATSEMFSFGRLPICVGFFIHFKVIGITRFSWKVCDQNGSLIFYFWKTWIMLFYPLLLPLFILNDTSCKAYKRTDLDMTVE